MKKTFNHTFRLNFAALAGYNSRCNLKCLNCHKDYFDVSHGFDPDIKLDFTSAINMVKSVMNNSNHLFQKIIITGHAEPLIIGKESFLKEVQDLRKNFTDISISITTNGSYLRNVIDDYLSIENTSINLSLHHNSYLKTKWFNHIAEYSTQYPNRLDLNVTIDDDSRNNLHNIIDFAVSKNLNVKFFHRLECIDPVKEINEFIQLINKTLNKNFVQSKKCEMNRYTLTLKSGSKIIIKLPENLDERPAACQSCHVRKLCVESCWQSIRITPWYIKPCGVRDDNVYFFTENSLQNLYEKLKSGGKQ